MVISVSGPYPYFFIFWDAKSQKIHCIPPMDLNIMKMDLGFFRWNPNLKMEPSFLRSVQKDYENGAGLFQIGPNTF